MSSWSALGWIALKDLKRLLRRRVDVFFVLVFPVVYAAFFTQIVSGSAAGASRIRVAVVDQDRSETSRRLVERLQGEEGLKVALLELDEAAESVRTGRRAAYVLIPQGLGAASSPRITLGVDPARQGEAGLLQGVLLRAGGELLGGQVRARLLGAQARRPGPARAAAPGALEPPGELWDALAASELLGVDEVEVGAAVDRPPVPAAVTLPQGTVWALLACAAAFGASLVGERATGTLRRLRLAPIGVLPILLGKGLACFLTIIGVCALLLGLVAPGFGVEVARWDLLAMAVVASGVCYVGLMLLIGTLGGTEDAAYRIGWAIILVLAMLGGAMVPTYLMPSWMDDLSWASPVRWSLLAFEGAIWRGFSAEEMALPCAVLTLGGITAFGVGAAILRFRLARGWGN